MGKRVLEAESDVRRLVKDWYARRGGYRFSVVSNGMGIHGILDDNGGIPLIVTPQMVGKRICQYVGVESKRPGRRGEKDRGMSPHQVIQRNKILLAGGLAICCDGEDDLQLLDQSIEELLS